MKRCFRCKIIKDDSEFYKHKGQPDGLNSWCKECFNKDSKERYKNNKTTFLRNSNKYRKNNREKINKRNQDYRKKNKEKIKAYYKANVERITYNRKKYNKENKEKIRAYARSYREKNKEKIAAKKLSDKNAAAKNLEDSYIKTKITQQYRIHWGEVKQEMIETKRLSILIKRQIKELSKATTQQPGV